MTATRPPVDEREAVLRRHLQTLGETALLPGAAELALAATMADGRAAENDLAALAGPSVPDVAAVGRLRDRVRDGESARATLIASARRLVVSIARRRQATPEHTVALLAAGDGALTRAVDHYDPAAGLPFSAFARWWVERAMREVERHPTAAAAGATSPSPADPELLTALGHLHEDDCRVIELRLGLHGVPPLSPTDAALVLGVDPDEEEEAEQRALAKLRHPCTPGDLTHLRRL